MKLKYSKLIKVMAAISFMGASIYGHSAGRFGESSTGDCYFQGSTNGDDLVAKVNTCFKSKSDFGLLVHKWDGQDAFGDPLKGGGM